MRFPWWSGLRGASAWARQAAFVSMRKRFLRVAPLLLLLPIGTADVKGSGSINFDSDANGTAEATLTTTGLGIGTASPSANLHVLGNVAISNNLGVGTTAPASSLDILGTLGLLTQTVSANATLSGNSVVLANTASDNVRISLPYAGNVTGRTYYVKKTTNSNMLWVDGAGNTIDDLGAAELSSTSGGYPFLVLVSDGRSWYITSQSGTDTIASSNLVGWWKLDESDVSGTAQDASVNNNTGTYNGSMTQASVTTGRIGKALNLDGVDDYVGMGNSSSNELSLARFSVCTWASFDTNSTTQKLFYRRGSTGLNYGLFFNDSSDQKAGLVFVSTGLQIHIVKSNVTLSTNTWYHLAGTYDGTNTKIYVNGTEQGNGAPSFTPATGTMPTEIGRDPYDAANRLYMDGLIDDARIYSRALTGAEVQALYQSGKL